MRTRVYFRKYPDGDIIAMFPDWKGSEVGPPGTSNDIVQSYMHIGQHGAASTEVILSGTVQATPEEYADLAEELKDRGYHLAILTTSPSGAGVQRLRSNLIDAVKHPFG